VSDWHFMARRRCLTGMLASLALSSAAFFMRPWTQNAPNEFAPAHQALLALLDHPRDAHAVGLAYLRAMPPSERSAEYLVNAIVADASLIARTPLRLRIVGPLVNERMRQDFSEGAVVTVDGWILSVTEARLYALVALA
jgi:hypothetical protein